MTTKNRPGKTKSKKVYAYVEKSGISDIALSTLLFFVSLPIRFKNIGLPSQVVFDEVHFGEFIGHYIKRAFFFDVHPPLAKLMMAYVALICGFDGNFDFAEIGTEYPKSVPHVQLRAFGAIFGALVVPLSFLTIRDAGHSRMAAVITALAICFENGLITNNRLILLDSYLLFFTAFTVFAWTRFYYKTKTFSTSWWSWLISCGVGLGCTLSSKWAGLFTFATIGLFTSKQLWELLGDSQTNKRRYVVHFFARVVCLIVIPAMIYVGSFYAHFAILNKSGPGSGYMELETQNDLHGYLPLDTPLHITYGSLVTLRQSTMKSGYLHSHPYNYPDGSEQQQITLYPALDDGNWWRILKADESKEPIQDVLGHDNTTWLEFVRAGDFIRLEHVSTAPKKLHSHDIAAPVTDLEYHKEVSGYGFDDHPGDSNDNWRVEIEESTQYPESTKFLQSRRTRFRLKHENQDCHLYGGESVLPEWGFDQHEITCIQEGLKAKTTWMIDETENDLLPDDTPMVPEHRPNFMEKLWRLHLIMWKNNNEIDGGHPFASRPKQWPTLTTNIKFWQNDHTQIILLGNPLVYWSSTLAVAVYISMWSIYNLMAKRGRKYTFSKPAGFFLVGWALHFFPFFRMERQLFLHHYMPALYFAVLTLGVGLDGLLRRFPYVIKMAVAVSSCACIIYTYFVYSPITYGEPWSVSQCKNARITDSWQLDCALYAPLNSSVRDELRSPIEDSEKYYQFVDQDGNHLSEKVSFTEQDTCKMSEKNETSTQDEEDEEYYDAEPTEAPEPIEYEPEFVDGKEVYGDDEDDEDEWPKTVYGTDPEADEDEEPQPLTVRSIPSTRHVDEL